MLAAGHESNLKTQPFRPSAFRQPRISNVSARQVTLSTVYGTARNRSMSQSRFNTSATRMPHTPWNVPVRVWHWLIAASLAGAAFLTAPGDPGHATLGWLALGALLIRVPGSGTAAARTPVHWLVAVDVLVLDLSGCLAPHGSLHTGASLVTLVLAALYCATVLFESIQRVTTRAVGWRSRRKSAA